MVKKNKYMSMATGSMKLGVASMAGLGALGAMSSVPGMPSQASNVSSLTGAGIGLANVGNLANIGMNIMPKTTKKKTGNKVIDNIL